MSLSWDVVVSDGEQVREWPDWPTRWMSLYLLLFVHVLYERAVLGRLAEEAADRVAAVRRAGAAHHAGTVGLSVLTEARVELRRLATWTVEHNMRMAPERPAAVTDYVNFHRMLRDIHGIREQRNELRAEVREMLALVDTAYDEIRARADQLARDAEARRQAVIEDRERSFERIVSRGLALLAPPSLVAGVLPLLHLERWNLGGYALTPLGEVAVVLSVCAASSLFGYGWLKLVERRLPGTDRRSIHREPVGSIPGGHPSPHGHLLTQVQQADERTNVGTP